MAPGGGSGVIAAMPPRTRSPIRLWHQGASALSAALLLAGCATRPAAPPEAVWLETAVGLCEDYPEESRSIAAARADLEAARAAGARVLRIAFGWDAMEPERGEYDWSFWDEFVRAATDDYGIRLIPYVCYTPRWAASDQGDDFWRSPPRDPEDFARFMTAIVERYEHAIDSWELWNEPDNPAYWDGSREEFAALVLAGSRAVRAADPDATVVLGGIATETDFLEALFAEDGIAPAVDVVNLHSYFETWHPDPIETLPEYIARAAAIVEEHGEGEPLWLAETGYSSVGGRPVVSEGVYRARFRGEHTDAAQADALARALALGLATGELPLIAWYRINDLPTDEDVIGDDNNRHLGVRAVDGSRKPALATLALFAEWFRQPYRILDTELEIEDSGGDAQPHARAFRLRDGRAVVVAWLGMPSEPSPEMEAVAASDLPEDSRRAKVKIRIAAPAQRARFVDAAGSPLDAGGARLRSRGESAALELSLRGGEVALCELSPR